MWDAAQYLKYADERARPFVDLLARVQREDARHIADLGCGPGNLTQLLVERWPMAHIVGVDHAPEMLEQARPLTMVTRLQFVQADLANWAPSEPIDVLISNAALQWVDHHEALLRHLTSMLAESGVLAIQMPYHFENPAHLAIEAAKAEPRWRPMLEGVGLHQQSVQPIAWYVDRLHALGFRVDAWQTTYIHVLRGANPVLEWFQGSALRPLLKKLNAEQAVEFLADLGARLRAAYPERHGVTLLPFPRIFFVATRDGAV